MSRNVSFVCYYMIAFYAKLIMCTSLTLASAKRRRRRRRRMMRMIFWRSMEKEVIHLTTIMIHDVYYLQYSKIFSKVYFKRKQCKWRLKYFPPPSPRKHSLFVLHSAIQANMFYKIGPLKHKKNKKNNKKKCNQSSTSKSENCQHLPS